MKLEIGYNHSFEIRKVCYKGTCNTSFSVLYLSDLHLNGFSKTIIARLILTIKDLNPDIILLGGDYVDTKNGLHYLNTLMISLSNRKNVFAIAGNHDTFLGIKRIKKIITDNFGIWIENDSITFKLKDTTIQIDGNRPGKIPNDNVFSILCLHKPIDLDKNRKYNLTFAGHLHGSQFVFWKSGAKLYPGKLFYKWNILETKQNTCHYYISKGLGDTIPIRYNCRKDVIFVNVEASDHP